MPSTRKLISTGPNPVPPRLEICMTPIAVAKFLFSSATAVIPIRTHGHSGAVPIPSKAQPSTRNPIVFRKAIIATAPSVIQSPSVIVRRKPILSISQPDGLRNKLSPIYWSEKDKPIAKALSFSTSPI